LLLAISGCTSGGYMQEMGRLQREYNQQARKEFIVYMSFQDLFPPGPARDLARAAGSGDVATIDRLVRDGVPVDSRGTQGVTPLFWAMKRSNLKGFTRLLKLGADPNVSFEDGAGILFWAVAHRNTKFLEMALSHGGNPNLMVDKPPRPLIFLLVDDERRLPILLDAGADFNARNQYDYTPSMLAAAMFRFDVVKLLLNRGADPAAMTAKDGKSLATITQEVGPRMEKRHELYADRQDVIEMLRQVGIAVE
jgi:ankyrin repeat protein